METAPSDPSASSGRETVLVDLALQGGGSHGAFTWDVLDRLPDEPWLRIDGISGNQASDDGDELESETARGVPPSCAINPHDSVLTGTAAERDLTYDVNVLRAS
jgi:hypothetical protein